MEATNIALVSKLAKPSSLWATILSKKYRVKEKFWPLPAAPGFSPIWKGILATRQLLKSGFCYQIYNVKAARLIILEQITNQLLRTVRAHYHAWSSSAIQVQIPSTLTPPNCFIAQFDAALCPSASSVAAVLLDLARNVLKASNKIPPPMTPLCAEMEGALLLASELFAAESHSH
ncbi:hypothetical protein CJ030_MR2G016870 [Morella rubra]|uniref:Uncharacterized protein n=1 Tax=Morella rubra TaxID=262757 RepID=A0A6A1WDX4_9ROSI|nr:hypothetical protein CJ030_MR2G016870 [Morella rubra]